MDLAKLPGDDVKAAADKLRSTINPDSPASNAAVRGFELGVQWERERSKQSFDVIPEVLSVDVVGPIVEDAIMQTYGKPAGTIQACEIVALELQSKFKGLNRNKQASDDEKMPDVPDSTLTRGQARALLAKQHGEHAE